MKFVLLYAFLLATFLPQAFASQNLSIIKSIDEEALPPSFSEASDEALPLDQVLVDEFTIIAPERVAELFNQLETNPKARNRIAGGNCAYRRSYIQSYLKKLSIVSGSLYIQCPGNIGHMKLIDQVTGHRYNFSNFHDANIVAVPGDYQVMDVQFKPGPMTLSAYLAELEASQKVKPLKNRAAGDKGYCYWSIR